MPFSGIEIQDLKPNKIVIEAVNSNMLIVFIYIEVANEKFISQINKMRKERCIGIDMGRKNICAIVNNFGEIPILIKDSEFVRLYEEGSRDFESHMDDLIDYLNVYINENSIDTMYVGDMYQYKPYSIIMEKLKKIKKVNFIVINEEFTSQASFLDRDIYNTIRNFSGERVTRGTYKTKKGIEVPADINAAYNILIKGNQFAFEDNKNVKIEPVIVHTKKAPN